MESVSLLSPGTEPGQQQVLVTAEPERVRAEDRTKIIPPGTFVPSSTGSQEVPRALSVWAHKRSQWKEAGKPDPLFTRSPI